MDSVVTSAFIVAIAEIGDKTQLLSLMLAAHYRKPLPIILGILGATLGNHALAAWFGIFAADLMAPKILHWGLAAAFGAMAVWCLIPDKAEGMPKAASGKSAFLATLAAFFLLEIGDKTQIATIALAARFHDLVLVTIGTTLGMMAVNIPAVLGGGWLADKVPMRYMRAGAALAFVIAAVLVLLGQNTQT